MGLSGNRVLLRGDPSESILKTKTSSFRTLENLETKFLRKCKFVIFYFYARLHFFPFISMESIYGLYINVGLNCILSDKILFYRTENVILLD
jgi:hypothetical protein